MKTQMKLRPLSLVIVAAAITGFAAPAFAQDAPPPGSAPAPEVKRSGRMAGDIASGGLGVGATMYVSGLAGPEVVYDFGVWHLGGMLAFNHQPNAANNNSTNTFDFGVNAWYHLHLGESSDFSVGGGFGLLTISPPVGNSATAFEFEPGAQIRAFITPNVALHAGMAFIFAFGDQANGGMNGALTKQIALAGQVTSNFGITYYFR
jgi:Outer membrane protein beta-barrel domain